jgi:protein-tyrosine phosphatase
MSVVEPTMLRMAEFVPNLRDLGGLSAADGTIAPNRLLRSAMPLSDDVAPQPIVWPPRHVIDLRSAMESEGAHPLSATGASISTYPLLTALRPGAAPPESLEELYLVMLAQSGHLMTGVVSEIAHAGDGPTLVHCAAGKDRTGISVALVLRLLGVKRDDVIADYLETARHEGAIEARFQRIYGTRRAELPSAYLATPQQAIVSVLDTWDAHEGGVLGWFTSVGGTAADIEAVGRRLIDHG